MKYLNRPELHIIQGGGNQVIDKLNSISTKIDNLKLVKPLPVTPAASGTFTGIGESIDKPVITESLSEIPVIENIEDIQAPESPASSVFTSNIGDEKIDNLFYLPKTIKITKPLIIPRSILERFKRLFINIYNCVKEF